VGLRRPVRRRGIGHLVKTDVYMRIMPPYLPYHRALVLLSGIFEVVLGILLLVPTALLAFEIRPAVIGLAGCTI
jgi:uncharacterized membrane protein